MGNLIGSEGNPKPVEHREHEVRGDLRRRKCTCWIASGLEPIKETQRLPQSCQVCDKWAQTSFLSFSVTYKTARDNVVAFLLLVYTFHVDFGWSLSVFLDWSMYHNLVTKSIFFPLRIIEMNQLWLWILDFHVQKFEEKCIRHGNDNQTQHWTFWGFFS